MAVGPELSVIIPTLDESAALRLIADRLIAAVAPYHGEILIVDDDSPDGTGHVVEELAQKGPFRLLLRHGRRGLSSAVLDGIATTTAPILVVMDADGSHPPELISRLVEPIRNGSAEFALASRHVPGGDPGPMSTYRRVISAGAAALARPLTPVRDPMSGFFAVRREVLARGPLRPLGYKIGLEILVKCRPKPVTEVGFVFADRVAGASKLGTRVMGSYLRHVGRLYAWSLSRLGRASRTR